MELDLVFKVLVVFTVIQRIVELILSKLNEKLTQREGGVVIEEMNYYFMVALHTTWLGSLLYFAFFKEIFFNETIASVSLVFFLLGQVLRLSAIFTLGKSWSTRIMYRPGAKVVKKGIFKLTRHPNYLGVVLEIAALPMFAGLFVIAGVYSFLNFIILYFRIKREEFVLDEYCNYHDAFNLKTVND